MNIAVFCSANEHIAASFFTATEQLGTWLAEHDHTLVYGGCDKGLMRAIGRSVHLAGGRVIGVIPRIIERENTRATYLDVDIPVETLSDRKDIMIDYADIAIALPGGIGTLDEIFTLLSAHTIGYHSKRVIIYNLDHFYDTTIALLQELQQQGMLRGGIADFIDIAYTLDDIEKCLSSLPDMQGNV